MTLSSGDNTGYDLVCPECRGNVPADEMICPSCGHDLRNPKQPTVTAAPAEPSAVPIEAAPGLAAFYASERALPRELRDSQPAGFWIRFFARQIDGLLFGVVYVFVVLVALNIRGTAAVLLLIGAGIGFILYEPIATASAARGTIGKRALNLAVVDLSGNRISFGRSIGRTLASILAALPLYLGYLMVAWRADNRALHDLIAGTMVIRKQ